MRTSLYLWIPAMILTVTGLVSVIRYRILLGGLLIVTGLGLGLGGARLD